MDSVASFGIDLPDETPQIPTIVIDASDEDDHDDDDFNDEKYNAFKGIADEMPDPERPTVDCTKAGLFPYPTDCTRFYECIENSDEIDWDSTWAVVQYECPPEMIFNPANETCDLPESIVPPRTDCSNIPGINANINEAIDDTVQLAAIEFDEEGQPGAAKNETNEICPSAGYFVHPDDCSEYYQCLEENDGNFTVVQFECPRGTIWNPERTNCSHPEEVQTEQNCRNLTTVDDNDEYKEEEDDLLSQNLDLDLNEFEVNDEVLIELPIHEDDEDKPVIFVQPPNQERIIVVQSPHIEADENDKNGDDDDKPVPDDETTEKMDAVSPSSEVAGENYPYGMNDDASAAAAEFICPSKGVFANPSDCRKYILCEDGFNVSLSCRPNEVFHSFLKECTNDWSKCPETPKCTKDNQQLADPNDNEYYYICSIRGFSPKPIFEVIRNRCPVNSVFNQSQQKCVSSSLVTADRR